MYYAMKMHIKILSKLIGVSDGPLHFSMKKYHSMCIQGDLGGKINILGGHNIGHCRKKFHTHLCIILNHYRDRAV
jgi:hypothetical protein